jgi:hypothetical protein
MRLPHPTICLHSDVFQITTLVLKPMTITDQLNHERLLTAAP